MLKGWVFFFVLACALAFADDLVKTKFYYYDGELHETAIEKKISEDDFFRLADERKVCVKRKGTPQPGISNSDYPFMMCFCGKDSRPMRNPDPNERCQGGKWVKPRPRDAGVVYNLPKFPNACGQFKIPEADLTNEELEGLLFDEKGELKVTNVDDLVPLLPDSMLERASVLYDTGSTHKMRGKTNVPLTTPTNPRVILSDETGQFRLAYVGCPDDAPNLPDCNRIEWQFFDRKTGKLEFREITLPGKNVSRAESETLRKSMTTTPNRCIGCHGDGLPKEAMRPLMEPYNGWHGFYGSLSRANRPVMGKDSQELKDYTAFIERVWAAPEKYRRYTALTWREMKNKADALRELGFASREYDRFGDTQLPPTIIHVPPGAKDVNSQLHKGLLEYDKFRVMQALTEAKDFEKYKWVIVAMSADCTMTTEALGDYLPESKAHFKAAGEKISKDMNAAFGKEKARIEKRNPIVFTPGKDARVDKDQYDLVTPLGDKAAVQLAYATGLGYVGDKLGVPIDAQGIAKEQPYVNRHGGTLNGSPPPFATTLAKIIAQCDPDIKKMLDDPDVGLCRELAKKSREALGAPKAAPVEKSGKPKGKTH